MGRSGFGPVLARRARGLGVSPTVAMAARAQALKARGIRVFDFTVGEPDQPTPLPVAEAGQRAIAQGRTRYTPASGLADLRAAVAERYRIDFDLPLSAESVCITVGGKQALAVVYQAILDRGSEVIVPVPAWPTFAEAARLAGGRPVLLPLSSRSDYALTARQVARAITPRTRALVVNSPSNPTGAVVGRDELVRLGRLARRHGLWLLYDDTYAHLVFAKGGAAKLREVARAAGSSLVVIGTASKSYCMTGWRIGWVAGPGPLIDACAALNSHSVQSSATFSQVAAVAALRGSQAPRLELALEYRRRRDLIHAALAGIPGIDCERPAGGFYLFPDVSRRLTLEMPDTIALCSRLLDEQSVAVVPGEGFFAPGAFRLSFATKAADLAEGGRRVRDFFAAHPPERGRR